MKTTKQPSFVSLEQNYWRLIYNWGITILLCEELIFPLHKGKDDRLIYEVIIFLPRAVEISFLHTKGCRNAIPVRNEEIFTQ